MAIQITLPSETLTFDKYDIKRFVDRLKTKPSGIYFIYGANDELLYIGKTNNFRSRLYAHFRGRDVSSAFYKLIEYVTVYFVNDEFERELYETYAINTHKPTYNRAKTYYQDNSDEIYEIDERIYELEEEKNEIAEDMCDDGLIDGDYETDEIYTTGVFFLNQERIKGIDNEIKQLKTRKSFIV